MAKPTAPSPAGQSPETAFAGGNNSAGVYGRHGDVFFVPGYSGAGVRGESPTLGVLGITNSSVDGSVAVAGCLLNTNGAALAEGYVGYHTAALNYGLYTTANLGGAGSKFFVEPHPTDASKVIRYISLEGPEPGTYFRGRGKFQRGMARIAVPEDFRMVTAEEGLSVQITPIGGMASVGVLRVNVNEIVVAGSRDLEFYYMVHGIRRSQKHLTCRSPKAPNSCPGRRTRRYRSRSPRSRGGSSSRTGHTRRTAP